MMKFSKPNQTRTYDDEGFKRRAACLCFRNEKEDEVLLVSSSRYPDQWIVPGGGMEPQEEPSGAAVREVYEEAGVKGKLGRLLGIFEEENGIGSPLMKRSVFCSATSLTMQNTYTDYKTPAIPAPFLFVISLAEASSLRPRTEPAFLMILLSLLVSLALLLLPQHTTAKKMALATTD
ncbi:nudix (nucleoside diphosphate linked moiety X)-type motif 4a isoform X2 [Cynoglossus semilaevis]|uniref:nudix (nucleoside diphosphate linked moiety X)-type motif 4a isoform X2 n=1 Tax=Cynoglossus semilaevis TaxID=244447 RepID=UPI000D62D6E6|nr:diphosphoinositol polyphosphate phosphohydrolase 2-like isoform X2 [Cynoglossus semilaevis]